MITPNQLDAVVKAAVAEAGNYAKLMEEGPIKSPMTGKPVENQLMTAVRMLRPGDTILQVLRQLPHTMTTIQAAGALDGRMREFEAVSLMRERPEQIKDLDTARRCLNELVGYTPDTIHSEAIIAKVYGSKSQMTAMWAPLAEAANDLIQAGEGDVLVRLVGRLTGVEDDNDLASAVSQARQELFDQYLATGEEQKGTLAYKMWLCDCTIMGSRPDLPRDQFLEAEVARYQQHADQRPRNQAGMSL